MRRAAALQLTQVGKCYEIEGRTLEVLGSIDLQVQSGQFIGIVGGSGCGKSTLLRLIAGLESSGQGELSLDGERIRGTSRERGIVFQEARLFPWLDVEQNIGLGLHGSKLSFEEKRRAVREHIELVGLTSFERAYPRQLSGGMAQRVALARALVNRPRLLLLDEPFGALDAIIREQMQSELLRIWQHEQLTVILVTHDVEEALLLADTVLVMAARPGRVARAVRVPLRRPRSRSHPRIVALRDEILRELGENRIPAAPALTAPDAAARV
jgi:sulfonate transport system ATP-binding protein